MNIFEKIFKALNDGGVDYLVIGGVAVNLYGYLRTTGDLDIVLFLNEENLNRTTVVMKKLGYTERLPIHIQELQNEEFARKMMKERNLMAFTYMPEGNNPLIIDVVIDESLRFKELADRSVVKDVGGVNVPIISIDDLIEIKRKAGRPKDMEDLRWLIKSKEL